MQYNVLIVDDSATTRALIARTVRLADIPGATVAEAADGAAALAALRSGPFDLVLADLHMPGMGGLELTRRMRLDPSMRSIPVAVVTAEPDERVLDALKAQEIEGVIRKPFRPEAVRDLVSRLAGRRAAVAGEARHD